MERLGPRVNEFEVNSEQLQMLIDHFIETAVEIDVMVEKYIKPRIIPKKLFLE